MQAWRAPLAFLASIALTLGLRRRLPRARRFALLLDCDDTLYSNDWELAQILTDLIDDYCTTRLGLPPNEAYKLYKKHGTCLRGLQVEGVRGFETEDFLKQVHDPLAEHIERLVAEDRPLREMLLRLRTDGVHTRVFTASCSEHATRCLNALGIYDVLVDAERPIIDVRSTDFLTKHDAAAYELVMEQVGVEDPANCILVDDSWSNMRAAKEAGWVTVLCGAASRDGTPASECAHADHTIRSIHELPRVLPHLFR